MRTKNVSLLWLCTAIIQPLLIAVVYSKQPTDFDNDGCADLVNFRTEGALVYLYITPSSNDVSRVPAHFERVFLAGRNAVRIQWGLHGDKILLADLNNDGFPEVIAYRPSNGIWYIRWSNWNGHLELHFPGAGVVHSADVDGDGNYDLGFINNNSFKYRLSNGTFGQIGLSRNVFEPDRSGQWRFVAKTTFSGRYLPVRPGDTGIFSSGWNSTQYLPRYRMRFFGSQRMVEREANENGANAIPIVGDFDGDGEQESGYYRDGIWRIWNGPTNELSSFSWGLPGVDIVVLGDFDGDGITDPCVYRSSTGTYYARLSRGVALPGWAAHHSGFACQWGLPGDDILGSPAIDSAN